MAVIIADDEARAVVFDIPGRCGATLWMIGHERDLGVNYGGDCDKSGTVQLTAMDTYRLFVYRDDRQLVGSAVIIDAANDDEAIAQAEVVRGSFAAELLDIEGLREPVCPGSGVSPDKTGWDNEKNGPGNRLITGRPQTP